VAENSWTSDRQVVASLLDRQVVASLLQPEHFLTDGRSIHEGRFFLKVNKYKLSLRDNVQSTSDHFVSFRKHMGDETAFAKKKQEQEARPA
jgi:hypothetical protein